MNAPISNGSPSLEQRLAEPDIVAALNRLLDRVESLEQAISALVDQGPGFTAMVTDMVDEGVQQAARRGVDIDDRLKTALNLAEQLTAPGVSEALTQALAITRQAPDLIAMVTDIADEALIPQAGGDPETRIKNGLELLHHITDPARVAALKQALALADQAPGFIAMVTDMADEGIRQGKDHGIDIDDRLRGALALAERLTRPQTVASVTQALEMADQVPGFIAMVTDMVDERIRTAVHEGIDVDARIKGFLELGRVLTDPKTMQALKGVLSPEATRMVAGLGYALAETQESPHVKLGGWGLLRATRDPDVQRALGFTMTFMKHFGHSLTH